MSDDVFEYLRSANSTTWNKVLDKLGIKKKKVLRITMSDDMERRIKGAVFMGNVESVTQFARMAFRLMEMLIDARARGAKMCIIERDGSIKEIGLD